MKEKSLWPSAIVKSLLVNMGGLFLLGMVMVHQSFAIPKEDPIEVSIVSDPGGGGQGITVPSHSTVAIPEPPQSRADAEAEMAQLVQESNSSVPTKPQAQQSKNIASADGNQGKSSDSGSGTGNASGEHSGNGAGDGSGSGSGAGEGSGNGREGTGETRGIVPIQEVAAVYPEEVRRKSIEGTAIIRIVVETDGSVSSSSLVSSSGNAQLDAAAVNVMYSWQFAPAKRNGIAVRSTAQIPYVFRLR